MEAEQQAVRVARSDATSATRDVLLEGQLGALDAAISRFESLGVLESDVTGPSLRWARVNVSRGAASLRLSRLVLGLLLRPSCVLRPRRGEGGEGRAR